MYETERTMKTRKKRDHLEEVQFMNCHPVTTVAESTIRSDAYQCGGSEPGWKRQKYRDRPGHPSGLSSQQAKAMGSRTARRYGVVNQVKLSLALVIACIVLGWHGTVSACPAEDSPCREAWVEELGLSGHEAVLAANSALEHDDGYCSLVLCRVEGRDKRTKSASEHCRQAAAIFLARHDAVGEAHVWETEGRWWAQGDGFGLDLDKGFIEGLEGLDAYRLRAALTVFEEAGDYVGQGSVWVLFGEVADAFGEMELSHYYYLKAQTFLEYGGNTRMFIVMRAEIAWLDLVVVTEGGNFNEFLYKALGFFQKEGNFEAQGLISNELGEWLIQNDQFQEAERLLRSASELPGLDDHHGSLQAEVTTNLGMAVWKQGRYDEGEDLLRTALVMWERARRESRNGEILFALGEIAWSKGLKERAGDLYRESFPYFSRRGDRGGEAKARSRLGDLEMSAGRPENAIANYDKALDLAGYFNDWMIWCHIQAAKARALEELGRFGEALSVYESSANVATRNIQEWTWDMESKSSRQEVFRDVFEAPVRLRLRLYTADFESEFAGKESAGAAFSLFEKARSPRLQKRLLELGKDLLTSILPEALRVEEAERNARIEEVKTLQASRDMEPDAAQEELKKLEAEGVSLANSLWANDKYRPYAAIRYPRDLALSEMQLEPQEVLIEFLEGDSSIYRLVVFRGDVLAFEELPWSSAEIAEKVRIVRRHASRPGDSGLHAERELFNGLVGDALKWVPKGGRLVLLPDGALAELPFEALVDSNGLALGLQLPVLYIHSARSLDLQRRQARAGINFDRDLMAFGDPVYDREIDSRCGGSKGICIEPRGRAMQSVRRACRILTAENRRSDQTSASTGERVPLIASNTAVPTPESIRELVVRSGIDDRLCASRDEVTGIANLFGVTSSDVILDLDASKAKLLDFLGQHSYRVLHMSTHGVLPDEPICATGGSPCISQPSLVMADTSDSFDDRFLTAGEVLEFFTSKEYRDRKLAPPALVTLSACHSAEGDIIRGEGVQGMGQAFLYAGVRNVVMSLWSVGDESSAAWMKVFYRAIQSGKDPATAAFEARRAIHDLGVQPDGQDWSRAFHWAPFIVTGMGETE